VVVVVGWGLDGRVRRWGWVGWGSLAGTPWVRLGRAYDVMGRGDVLALALILEDDLFVDSILLCPGEAAGACAQHKRA
jgi:hypothetical protein